MGRDPTPTAERELLDGTGELLFRDAADASERSEKLDGERPRAGRAGGVSSTTPLGGETMPAGLTRAFSLGPDDAVDAVDD